MLNLVTLLLAGHAMNLEQTIRDRRTAYNAAISARDLAGIGRMLAPDYVVLPGLTGTPLSKEGLLTLFKASFQDRSFVTYVRTPTRVQPSRSSKRIAETGRWTGTWNKPDGVMTVSGVYQAFWIPDRRGW